MPDFTSVFTQERDHWQARAEAAEAELALRDGYQVRPMTETESNLMTQVLDLRQERAALQAEVERLRGALDGVRERADRAASIKAWSDGDGPSCDEANGLNAVGEDVLRLIEGVLRGGQ